MQRATATVLNSTIAELDSQHYRCELASFLVRYLAGRHHEAERSLRSTGRYLAESVIPWFGALSSDTA